MSWAWGEGIAVAAASLLTLGLVAARHGWCGYASLSLHLHPG